MELNFNASTVAPASADFEPIPAAWYQMVVEKAELKPTKAGTGSMVSLQCRVQGPDHANRVIFANINYQNPSDKAQEIGQRQLSALCHSIGVLNLTNVTMLQGIPFDGRVKITPAVYNVIGDKDSGVLYEARNEIQGYRPVGGATAAAPAASTAPAKPSAPTAPAKPTTPVAPAQVADPEASQAQPEPTAPAATVATPAQPW